MTPQNTKDALRETCRDEALHAYGTAYIFEKRAKKYGKGIRVMIFLGIAVPAIVGAIGLSFGREFAGRSLIITLAGILGVAQLAISVWSLVYNWRDRYAYSHESMSANQHLSDRFDSVAKSPLRGTEFKAQYEILKAESKVLRRRDQRQEITEKEKRMGMRAALRNFQRQCAGCERVPTSMKPTDCPVCGNF